MSSYFDAIAADVSAESEKGVSDGDMVEFIVDADRRLFEDVVAITGDREFPVDLREKILGVFAIHSAYQPGSLEMSEETRIRVATFHYSVALQDIHALFHQLASRRILTRFGTLSDDPVEMVARRNAYAEAWLANDDDEPEQTHREESGS